MGKASGQPVVTARVAASREAQWAMERAREAMNVNPYLVGLVPRVRDFWIAGQHYRDGELVK
jgi:hypothetical protein